MNKIALSFLAAVLVGQLSWLGISYHARVREIAESPHILVEVEQYDPRDLFRGDYVNLSFREAIPLQPDEPRLGRSLCWEKGSVGDWLRNSNEYQQIEYAAREKQGDSVPLNSYATPLAAFVRKGEDGLSRICRVEAWGSREDVCREGERRLPTRMHAIFRVEEVVVGKDAEGKEVYEGMPICRLSADAALRYYVPEKKGNLVWEVSHGNAAPKPVKVTMECAVREKNGLIPVQLYVDGVPYLEAYARMQREQGKTAAAQD